jgi:hypothetical protein
MLKQPRCAPFDNAEQSAAILRPLQWDWVCAGHDFRSSLGAFGSGMPQGGGMDLVWALFRTASSIISRTIEPLIVSRQPKEWICTIPAEKTSREGNWAASRLL